jgi:hypothetical protein
MKTTEQPTPAQVRPENTSHSSLYDCLKNVSMTGLLFLSGGSHPEASSLGSHTAVLYTPEPQQDTLVVPQTIEPYLTPKITMSDKLKREQDRFNTRPSDISRESAYLNLRSAIRGEITDTATIDVALSTLRPAYNPRPEAQAHQRRIVDVVTKHANITEQRFHQIIEENHQEYLERLPLTSQRSALEQSLGLARFQAERSRRLNGIEENTETIRKLTSDANLEKIDLSIQLLRELSTLFQAKEQNAPYDAKRLKTLSRMCESKTLDEVNEKLPLLELLRKRSSDAIELPIRTARDNSALLERAITDIESAFNTSWCEDYDRMSGWMTKLRAVDEALAERSSQQRLGPRDSVGSIVDTNLHPQLRVDMAAVNLGKEAITEYVLRNEEGNTVATVLDRGQTESNGTNFIHVALDEPSTTLSIHSEGKTGAIKSSSGLTFDRRDLDLKETIQSEIAEDFRPSFTDKGRESSALFKNSKVRISVYMNPGCALDIRDATSWSPEIRARGAGTFIVGELPKDASYVKVEVASTLANEAPLLLSMPASLSIDDLQITPGSGTGLIIVAGNAKFEINGPSEDGRGDNVDVEIKTPRGVQHIPVVRNGRCVYGRNN